jgi:DNA-binding MarR family transcriptional regulator
MHSQQSRIRKRTPVPPNSIDEDLDELPRRILRSWVTWKSALDANYAAVELDGTAPSGSGMIMFALLDRDGWTIGELAARSKVTHVAVLHLVQKLEAARLVTRRQCTEDGRATRVWLTQRGRDIEPKMRELHNLNLATLTRVLGKEDATRLGALLGRLIEGLAADSVSSPETKEQSPKAVRSRH